MKKKLVPRDKPTFFVWQLSFDEASCPGHSNQCPQPVCHKIMVS